MEGAVAVLIDAGYLWNNAGRILSRHWNAEDVIDLSLACVKPGENLFRIFFYDCPPFGEERRHPMTGKRIDYSEPELYHKRCEFLNTLSGLDYIALRKGRLSHKGWKLRDKALTNFLKGRKTSIEEKDLVEDFHQKTVDMKIGLDVAWLSSRGIVSAIVLIGSDTDYIPAMKHARREGSRVVMACFQHPGKPGKPDLHPDLLEHADECRLIQYDAGVFSMIPRLR